MALTTEGKNYIKAVMSPMKFKIGMLTRLPSIYFWGASVKQLDEQECIVSLPFKWATKNPFKSIYFGAQAGIAELSTGLMVESQLKGRGRWSMLVVDFQAQFSKKADGRVEYRCNQGDIIAATLDKVEATGQPQTMVLESVGYLKSGVEVGRVKVTWSLKKKS